LPLRCRYRGLAPLSSLTCAGGQTASAWVEARALVALLWLLDGASQTT